MPVKHPFNIYREQLWPLYHGFALWKPNPVEGIYDQVSIGDVGYIREGGFIRMFNVTLPCDDESNKKLGEPCRYDPLSSDSFAIRRENFGKIDYYSRRVSREETVGNTLAASPDDAECVTYRCRGRGALLSLPNGGLRQDVIHTKVFQKYIKDNVATWFDWSMSRGLPINNMEDLVFVCGCTLVPSWAAAAFDDHTGNAQLSLASRTLNNGGTGFTWSNIRGTVEYHDSQLNPNIPHPSQNRCVFVKCLRAKHVSLWALYCRRIFGDDEVHLEEFGYSNFESCSSVSASTPSDEASYDADEVPHDADEAPHDVDEAPHDVDEAPHDVDEAPHDADEALHDAGETPHDVDEASHVADEIPHDADEAPHDVDEAPHDAGETPHDADEASHDVDEAPRDADEAFFHTSAASFPYDPNSRRGSVMHLSGVSDDPEYLDPLIGVLNYIREIDPEDGNAMAVAHDNDLQLIETMNSLTGNAVQTFLHENKIPVLLENGVMTLQYPDRQVNEQHGESDKESSD